MTMSWKVLLLFRMKGKEGKSEEGYELLKYMECGFQTDTTDKRLGWVRLTWSSNARWITRQRQGADESGLVAVGELFEVGPFSSIDVITWVVWTIKEFSSGWHRSQ